MPWQRATTLGHPRKTQRFFSRHTQPRPPSSSEIVLRSEIVRLLPSSTFLLLLFKAKICLCFTLTSLSLLYYFIFLSFLYQRWGCTREQISSKTKPSSSVRSHKTPYDKPCSHSLDSPKILWKRLLLKRGFNTYWRRKRLAKKPPPKKHIKHAFKKRKVQKIYADEEHFYETGMNVWPMNKKTLFLNCQLQHVRWVC